ncbi:ionotropic receptor 93a [Diabrotica virgifera virgifera]|uniref:Ionotropic receptor 93a isoform X1 n=1 Tax=Diabrotica virgifera virgifera TaxID=50390 RepID=A0A6P7FG00_DIAVI|nr:ionotropic receptor 93a [Diabrotica virgifera virgifera]KAI2474042.1 Ionotropic receptor 93a [Diabrotica virgifera virgifera]
MGVGIYVWFSLFALVRYGVCESFPSLLTTNASIAIVIDREFLAEEYDQAKAEIDEFLVYAKREILKHGGVNVYFYSWTAINVRKDLTAIFSIASCYDTWKLFKTTEGEDLVHMAISEPDCPRLPPNTAMTIPLITSGEELPQIILDLRESNIYVWKTLVVIYDSTVNRDMITRVIKSITQSRNSNAKATGISLMKLDVSMSRSDLREVMSTINPKVLGNNYLVIASYYLVGIVMEHAKSLNLASTTNQWMYIISNTNRNFQDIQMFESLLKEGDNIAYLYNASFTTNKCVGGRKCHMEELFKSFTRALDLAIQEEFDTASQVSEEEWEAIRPVKSERRDFLLKNMKNYLSKNGVCDNCTYWQMKTGETWGVEYQTIDQKAQPRLLSVGTWRPSDGAEMTDELFLHVAHGFRGKVLPMITFHNPPWQILKFNSSGDVIEYSGLIFDVIFELSRNLNFTFRLEIVNKTDTGSSNSTSYDTNNDLTNKVPKILVDLIKNKTVALGACAVTVTDDMKLMVNFTRPITILTYTFLVSRPKELSRALLFISPFTMDTWLGLATAIVSMGPLLYFIHRHSPVYEYKGIAMKGGLASIQNCIWYMYGALLQQGGMHLPYADSARLLVGAWWLVVLIMATTYCGNLVAFLTFPKIDIPITTLEDLIAHKDTVSWSFREGSYLERELRASNEHRYRTIFEERSRHASTDDDAIIQNIEDGKHVYIDWKMKLQFIMKKQFMKTGRCDFVLGLEEFFDEKLSLVVAPESPYLPKINEEIKKLHQMGLIEKWLKDYLPKRDRCWKNRHLIEVNNHTVNLDDMQGSFFVLFMGFTASLLILLFEKLWNKHFGKHKQKTIQPFVT